MPRVFLFLAAATLLADPRCVSCHQSIVESYARTGKARSISKPRAEVQAQRQWFHDFSGRRVGVQWQQGKLSHWMEIRGAVESHEMEWAIGSGKEGKFYLHRQDDSLFLSAIGWYASRMIWDMAPGYVVDASPSFYRPPSAPDCLQCHAGAAARIPGTYNRFADPPIPSPAIGCDRCHGDPTPHLAKPAKNNIVNPAKLPAPRRDAVCESCHLAGEARALNPGKQFADFKPGMALEDVFTIYVAAKGADDTILRTQTQAEQLAASRCAIASQGKLWCGTCHDSHKEPSEKFRAAWYRDKCQQCHTGEPAETHVQRMGDDCVRCHMRKERQYDGSHAARTDHWIRTAKTEERFLDRGELLRAWREPPATLQDRNAAIGYLHSAERTRSLRRLREGLGLLDRAVREGHSDGDVALEAGLQYARQKSPDRAVPWFEKAVAAQPSDPVRRLHLAAALANLNRPAEAKQAALEALRLEPLFEQAYTLLGQIEPNRAEYWKDQYRKAVPRRLLP
ncbi:MAG TPA: multiheme c-type cytochrome [Bryobacteraceae bacterium]|nr:multiheme c-type cytochrome [Bryobacteraceae bacterium]